MAAYNLVGNGNHLYRRDGHLVRTPIYEFVDLPLTAAEIAYYPLCGEYAVVGSDRSPGRGYCSIVGLITEGDCTEQGFAMRKAYCGVGASTYQAWWRSNADKAFVFLQGRYGVTAANNFCCEAFMQIPAVKFSIPSAYAGYEVVGATLGITHYGCICAYQQADTAVRCGQNEGSTNYYAAEAPTSILAADSDWRSDWSMRVGVYGDGITGMSIKDVHNAATDDITLNTSRVLSDLRYTSGGDTYTRTGALVSPILGNISLSYASDKLATTTSPWTQTVSFTSSMVSAFNTNRGGWVCISPNVGYSSSKEGDDDYPFYNYSKGWGRWLSCGFGGYNVTVRLRRSIV